MSGITGTGGTARGRYRGRVGVIDKKSCGISDGVGDGVGVILNLKCDGKNCTQYGV